MTFTELIVLGNHCTLSAPLSAWLEVFSEGDALHAYLWDLHTLMPYPLPGSYIVTLTVNTGDIVNAIAEMADNDSEKDELAAPFSSSLHDQSSQ